MIIPIEAARALAVLETAELSFGKGQPLSFSFESGSSATEGVGSWDLQLLDRNFAQVNGVAVSGESEEAIGIGEAGMF